MSKSAPVRRIAGETGLTTPDAGAGVNSVPSGIAGSFAREEAVSHSGLGTFDARRCPARAGRNPGTDETLDISASTVAGFKAGKRLRHTVNADRP